MIVENIIKLAQADIGITEIPGNMGWADKNFQALMEARGWKAGMSWCILWCEKIWKAAYEGTEVVKDIDRLFDASAVKTYQNCLKDKTFVVDKHCSPGSIAIWQHYDNGKASWQGHAGIVTREAIQNQFRTIEGNSNRYGGREGKEVTPKFRLLNFDAKNNLVLRGFLHPVEV